MSPKNIVDLAEKNKAVLDRLNFEIGVDDPLDLCKPEAYLATDLFTADQVADIFESVNRVPQTRIVNHDQHLPQNVGMILIRPDMLHVGTAFEDLLRERFTVLDIEDVEMTSEAYWGIYRHDLYRADTMHTRLTRAAMYIGSSCRLIVYADLSNDDYNLADYSRNTLRGNQGVFTPGTLRGEIVYKAGLDLGLQLLDDETVALATDPFGAYRSMSARPSGPHAGMRYPLLFYTGVGVHVPDGVEITNDLPTLSNFSPRQTATSDSWA